MTQPYFSVVIPTYNRAGFIARTLDTVMAQTFRDFEVIVVDDCSTDGTADVLAPRAERGEIRLVRHERNQERGAARNTGMDLARGKFVTFLDSDDLMYPTNLADAADYAGAHPDLRCFHNLLERVTPTGAVLHRYRYPRLGNQLRAIAAGNFLSSIGVFVHEDVVRSHRFDTDRALSGSEDWEFWLRVLAEHRVGRINKVNSAVVDHPGRSLRGEDLQVVSARKLAVVARVRDDPRLSQVYRPYLRLMSAGTSMFLASAASTEGRFGTARRFLADAVVADPRCVFSIRFARALGIAALRIYERPAGEGAVLATAVYPSRAPSTRLRVTQYEPFLRAGGWELRTWTMLRDHELDRWFEGRHIDRVLLLLRGLARLGELPGMLRGARVVIIQREVLPFGPPVVEWMLARARPLVWDVDDAIWEPYPGLFVRRLPAGLRKTGAKYERVCRMATEVWAGSEVLARWCRERNPEVVVVPTPVDVPAAPAARPGGRTVGWIGSPSTAPFLGQILPSLHEVKPAVRLLAVGAPVRPPPGLDIDVRPWSPAAEEQALAEIDVGLYPVDRDHPLAEGKCGFKAILYMSRGIPSVVTPTSANRAIVRHDEEGLHANSDDEWRVAVTNLLDDPELAARLGKSAHLRATTSYSLARWGPIVTEMVRRLA